MCFLVVLYLTRLFPTYLRLIHYLVQSGKIGRAQVSSDFPCSVLFCLPYTRVISAQFSSAQFCSVPLRSAQLSSAQFDSALSSASLCSALPCSASRSVPLRPVGRGQWSGTGGPSARPFISRHCIRFRSLFLPRLVAGPCCSLMISDRRDDGAGLDLGRALYRRTPVLARGRSRDWSDNSPVAVRNPPARQSNGIIQPGPALSVLSKQGGVPEEAYVSTTDDRAKRPHTRPHRHIGRQRGAALFRMSERVSFHY